MFCPINLEMGGAILCFFVILMGGGCNWSFFGVSQGLSWAILLTISPPILMTL